MIFFILVELVDVEEEIIEFILFEWYDKFFVDLCCGFFLVRLGGRSWLFGLKLEIDVEWLWI